MDERKFLVASCEQVVKDIKRWADQCWPIIDWDLVPMKEVVTEDTPIPDVVPVVELNLESHPSLQHQHRVLGHSRRLPQTFFAEPDYHKKSPGWAGAFYES